MYWLRSINSYFQLTLLYWIWKKIGKYHSLGRPFLATGRTLIDVQQGKLILRAQDEQVECNVFKAIKYSFETDCYLQIDIIDRLVEETFMEEHPKEPLEACIVHVKSTTLALSTNNT